MNKDKFPEKVLSIFNNNLNKVKVFRENKIAAYEMNVFLPYKEVKENEFPDFTGYNLSLEVNIDRVKLKVRELKLRPVMQGIKWSSTESVVEMIFFKESLVEKEKTMFFKEVQKFINKYNEFLEEDKENKVDNIKSTFLTKKMVVDDPTLIYVEKLLKEKKNYSEESFQQEPNIMIFGEEDDNTH